MDGPGFSGFATWCARLYRPNRAEQWFYCGTNGTNGASAILRAAAGSGKALLSGAIADAKGGCERQDVRKRAAMKRTTFSLALGLSAAVLVLPAIAQESLLPEGFGTPDTPAQRPAPTPTPSPTPAPGSHPANGGTPPPVVPTAGGSASDAVDAEDDDGDDEEVESGGLKYDLPPGARRLLTRIGPLTPETGGLAPDAFGVRGQYAATIMRKTNGQLASRWGQILLRR